MLPVPSVDDQRFSEIVEQGRGMIAGLYPQWTDYNVHDPGITFLELFAWLKEMQQYHMDQIGPAGLRKFLKLLDAVQAPRTAASLRAAVEGVAEDRLLLEGTRLLAGDIPFETVRTEPLFSAVIVRCDGFQGGAPVRQGSFPHEPGARCRPFGGKPAPGDVFSVAFDRPIPAGERLSLWFDVFGDYPVRRNPITAGASFVPMARLVWEALTPEGWRKLPVLEDSTHALIADGWVRLGPAPEMAPDQEGLYRVRAILTGGVYDVAPVLLGLRLNVVETALRQTLALCREFDAGEDGRPLVLSVDLRELPCSEAYGFWAGAWRKLETLRIEPVLAGTAFTVSVPPQCRAEGGRVRLLCWGRDFPRMVGSGDGFPGQRFTLFSGGMLEDTAAVWVAGGDGGWEQWERVADFDASGPGDRHYILDGEEGLLLFGDRVRGRAPEGEILLASCVVSRGAGGNVKAGSLDRFVHENGLKPVNWENAFGGRDRETPEECFRRVRDGLSETGRAVTCEDYEVLARETPGLMIRGCRAIQAAELPGPDGSVDETCISLVVLPYREEGDVFGLPPAYRTNLLAHLEPRRLLGTRIALLPAVCVEIELFAEIAVNPGYPDAPARVRRAVETYFGDGAWEFGKPVLYGSLYSTMDTLDCVSEVRSLALNARSGGVRRDAGGDILLPPNGIARLTGAEYRITAVG